jgi:protein-L-isoaspartate(D-aspartate) O-methyltransferase
MPVTLDDYRRFYADEICVCSNIRSQVLANALASVPRERYLGPGPWQLGSIDLLGGGSKYRESPDADPRHLYHNVVVAIDPSRDLNNGHPGTLAAWIDALELQPGDRVFHMGCGVGYYTAIMAEIVGTAGRVTAAEIDTDLADRARRNLSHLRSVDVVSVDGVTYDPGPQSGIFVNAGVTHPQALWLDRLTPNGRLLLPLTVEMGAPHLGKGAVFLIRREERGYSARMVSYVMIYSSSSGRDAALQASFGKALASGTVLKVRSLRRDPHAAAESCCFHGDGFCFSSDPPA